MTDPKSRWINTYLEYDSDGNLIACEGFNYDGPLCLAEPIENQQLVELRGKKQTVVDRVARAFEEANTEIDGKAVHDFTRVKVYGAGLSTHAVAEKVKADPKEMDKLGEEIETVKAAAGAFERLTRPVDQMIHPALEDTKDAGKPAPYKSIGQKILDIKGLKENPGSLKQILKSGEVAIPGVSINEFKTLFETSAGWDPESVRFPQVVPAVTRPIQLLDIMPTGQIGQAAAKYMEETTRTHNAAEKAEGAAYAESVFVLTERTQTVEKITDSIPVTDEQLEDVSMANSYLEERIRFGIRQRLDNQVMQGSGVTPNLEGILNVSGIQTQAKGADSTPDAFFKAMTKLMVTGRVNATHHVMHPNDWQAIRLLRTPDGIYIWGNPSEAGPERLWGLPVVKSDVMTENTGLSGAFEGAWIQLLERRGLVLEVGFTGSQFVEGKQTIRASMRVVLVTYRPVAFCTVTGI